MASKVNYSAEMVAAMEAMYKENHEAGLDNADNLKQIGDMLEAKFGQFRTVTSIRGKLTRANAEGVKVYQVDEVAPKAQVDNGPTKKELAYTLETRLASLGLSSLLDVNNIMNATKAGFQGVLDLVSALSEESAEEVEGEEA